MMKAKMDGKMHGKGWNECKRSHYFIKVLWLVSEFAVYLRYNSRLLHFGTDTNLHEVNFAYSMWVVVEIDD